MHPSSGVVDLECRCFPPGVQRRFRTALVSDQWFGPWYCMVGHLVFKKINLPSIKLSYLLSCSQNSIRKLKSLTVSKFGPLQESYEFLKCSTKDGEKQHVICNKQKGKRYVTAPIVRMGTKLYVLVFVCLFVCAEEVAVEFTMWGRGVHKSSPDL